MKQNYVLAGAALAGLFLLWKYANASTQSQVAPAQYPLTPTVTNTNPAYYAANDLKDLYL